MKSILWLSSVILLLGTSGCLVEDGGRRHHDRDYGHADVIVGPPVVVVHPAEVIVR